ncbi:hypothetical protein [Aureibacillus halotolerans]|uniref:hypothetical protein n=1 Tax=Aureibacillus halotolerans TaxID=1508390 RepID=UPI00105CFFCC|nr:hypothetical protein [Aureibacillus halotolerans]
MKPYQDWMEKWLDNHFDTPHREFLMSHPAKTDEDDFGVPVDMQDGEEDEEGWVRWKMIPSTVTVAQIRELERAHGLPVTVPPLYAAYFTTRFVMSVTLRYNHFGIELPGVPSAHPLRDVHALWENGKSLIRESYIPFATYEDGAGPICWDMLQPREDGDYPVVWFDHEALTEGERIRRSVLETLAQPLFPGFQEMLSSAGSA